METREVKSGAVNWWPFLIVVLLVLGFSDGDSLTNIFIGVFGGLIGCAVGVSVMIKRAKPPPERALWVQATVVMLLVTVSFAVAWVLVPDWYRLLLFIPYGIGLFLLIRHSNRRLAEIQTSRPASAA